MIKTTSLTNLKDTFSLSSYIWKNALNWKSLPTTQDLQARSNITFDSLLTSIAGFDLHLNDRLKEIQDLLRNPPPLPQGVNSLDEIWKPYFAVSILICPRIYNPVPITTFSWPLFGVLNGQPWRPAGYELWMAGVAAAALQGSLASLGQKNGEVIAVLQSLANALVQGNETFPVPAHITELCSRLYPPN